MGYFTYIYDVQDRLQTRTDPLNRQESYAYDLSGNLKTFTDRKSQVSTFTYDALNRRTLSDYADGSSTSFIYDTVGRLTVADDSLSGRIELAYDTLDRLIQELTSQGTVAYTYDAISRRTTMTGNGQQPVSYSYDAASRLTQVAQGSQVVGLGYDAAGRRNTLTYPNGVSTSYGYDQASRLLNILHQGPAGVIENLTYAYDAAGNRISFNRTSTTATLLPAAVQAAYDAANEQVQFDSSTPNLTYDANGNLATQTDAQGTTTYTWDARNRLVSISGPGVSASFVYDALGRRMSKTINGVLTDYQYDGNDIVAEIGSGAVGATYLRSLNIDEPFVRQAGGNEYYHTDALGSVLVLSDQAGAVQTTYRYEPFGETTIAGISGNPFQYTGRENDGVGLYYYRARYYSSVHQRFLSQDPFNLASMQVLPQGQPDAVLGDFFVRLLLKQPQQLHAYAYVQGNPLRFADPYGLLTIFGGGGFIAVGPAGFEGSAGLYADTGKGTAGYFASLGGGAGINVSADIFGGVIFRELQGVTLNTNVVLFSLVSITVLIDPITGDFVGGTLGLGPSLTPFALSETINVTATSCLFNCTPPIEECLSCRK